MKNDTFAYALILYTFTTATAGFLIGLTYDNFRNSKEAIRNIKRRLQNKSKKK